MFVECANMKGRAAYLRVAETYNTTINGETKIKKRIIKNIGPLHKYDDGKPEYVKRLKESFKEGKPIIEELKELAGENPTKNIITIKFDKRKMNECMSENKNIGYFLLEGLYEGLGIYDVLNLHKSKTNIQYDLNGMSKLLVFGRALLPDSKIETWNGRENYVFEVVSTEHQIEIYRALSVLDEKSEAIQQRMNHKVTKQIGRNGEICYYDVTNYWFEIDDNDEDIADVDGQTIKEGLRKRGPSKAKNRKPITQMGLFMDDKGIPISYQIFPGNHIDQTTLRPALKSSIDKMGYERVIVVADGGLNSDKNIGHILSEANGYIFSKSTKKSSKCVKEWIIEETGYEYNEKNTFKVKSKIRERTITDENGEKVKIREKLVSFWSLAHYQREVKENKKFIEYLESVIAFPDKLKDNEKKIEKFLNKMEVDEDTGEVLENTKTVLSVNMDKVKLYMSLMGYYTLLTSEVDLSDKEIINKYHGLSRIEDSFRVIKSDLDGRPVYVRRPEHVNAHFLICFVALTMIRIIQFKILLSQGKDPSCDDGWETGLSAERIKKALASFMADQLPGDYFRITKPSDDLLSIFSAFGIDPNLLLPSLSDLRQFKFLIANSSLL